MRTSLRNTLAIGALLVLALNATAASAATPGVTLVGKGLVAGNAQDKSGLTGRICQANVTPLNCVPRSIFGGFGSDLTYTGHDGVFVAAPDRGPFDGLTDVPYLNRFHFLHLTTDVGASFPNIHTTLLDTRMLEDKHGNPLVGAAGSFADRFDPEGIRVSTKGTFYLSDEYGPYIREFDRHGREIGQVAVPDAFAIANPSAVANDELQDNTSGRQANRGMEGLAISPDGGTLFGIMQNALLQDHALNPGTVDRISVYTRILKVDLATGGTKEYVYPLDNFNRGQGVSEILAINDHEFLVLERDNRSFLTDPNQGPTRKTIYRISIDASTTDVTGIVLPASGPLPAGVKAVTKDPTPFIDLLDPTFNLTATIAEKLEGLAWGPDLPDGRHLLYVISDNDLNPALPTQIYSFAIDPSALAYEPQATGGPLFPPGQVQKLTR